MRKRYHVVETDGIYFITSTIIEWIPVFTSTQTMNILTESFQYCRENKGLKIYAYVILDNHFHMIAESDHLVRLMQSIKRHTAKEILTYAENSGKTWLSEQFACLKHEEKKQSRHQIWQDGYHPQLIYDADMFRQKITYIHNNPVRRGLVESPEDWLYSSARNMLQFNHTVMDIDDLPF